MVICRGGCRRLAVVDSDVRVRNRRADNSGLLLPSALALVTAAWSIFAFVPASAWLAWLASGWLALGLVATAVLRPVGELRCDEADPAETAS